MPRAGARRASITPQLVVNGTEGRRRLAPGRGQWRHRRGASCRLPVDAHDRRRHARSRRRRPGRAHARRWSGWSPISTGADVEIERGENAGKTDGLHQIVTGRQVLGMWEPASGAHLKLPLAEVLTHGSNGAVILVQEEHDGLPGPILGARCSCRGADRAARCRPLSVTAKAQLPPLEARRAQTDCAIGRMDGTRASWFGGSVSPGAGHWRQ